MYTNIFVYIYTHVSLLIKLTADSALEIGLDLFLFVLRHKVAGIHLGINLYVRIRRNQIIGNRHAFQHLQKSP